MGFGRLFRGRSDFGSTAYLADGPYGLRVVDVTNPAAPLEIAHAFDMNYAYAVAVSGRYAYIAAAGAGLLVVDVSDPAYPVELGGYDTAWRCAVAWLCSMTWLTWPMSATACRSSM